MTSRDSDDEVDLTDCDDLDTFIAEESARDPEFAEAYEKAVRRGGCDVGAIRERDEHLPAVLPDHWQLQKDRRALLALLDAYGEQDGA